MLPKDVPHMCNEVPVVWNPTQLNWGYSSVSWDGARSIRARGIFLSQVRFFVSYQLFFSSFSVRFHSHLSSPFSFVLPAQYMIINKFLHVRIDLWTTHNMQPFLPRLRPSHSQRVYPRMFSMGIIKPRWYGTPLSSIENVAQFPEMVRVRFALGAWYFCNSFFVSYQLFFSSFSVRFHSHLSSLFFCSSCSIHDNK
jgi:hypothetical protein